MKDGFLKAAALSPALRVADCAYNTAQILQELRATRERGFSIDNCEHEANVRCVGVPVYNARGRLVAGISSSGPAPVMTDRKLQECADILLDITQRIRERLYA